MIKKILLTLLIFSLIISTGCSTKREVAPIVGGDKDIHGCIGSAGYTWCETKQKCLRTWEENCAKENDFEDARKQCESFSGIWIEASKECEEISEDDCVSIGGIFNECASACRNNPEAEICTMQCVIVCQFDK